jgi:hypothetical protein
MSTLCKCTYKTGSWYLPAFVLWKPFSERLPAVCVTAQDGGESAVVCVHQFLFPSGENWCWNVWNAASSFRRDLPKSIEDIWVVFPFQKWMPILWRWHPSRQPSTSHTKETVTCVWEIIRADQCLTIREIAEEVRIALSLCQQILTEDLQMRCVTTKFVLSPDSGAEGWLHVSLHWTLWLSPKQSQHHVLGNHW